jgi:hypothetical protein
VAVLMGLLVGGGVDLKAKHHPPTLLEAGKPLLEVSAEVADLGDPHTSSATLRGPASSTLAWDVLAWGRRRPRRLSRS